MKLEFKEKLYYTRSSKGKIGFCREGNYTPEEYVKNCQKQGYDVIKASYNIIDILEVGDYVNGYKVEKVNNNLSEHKGICNSLDTYLWGINDLDEFEKIVIFENDIKSVVTKEEFESMKYRIEDE